MLQRLLWKVPGLPVSCVAVDDDCDPVADIVAAVFAVVSGL